MSYEHTITVEPDKGSGKPCIRGLRITVQDVMESLASGMTEDEITADFSELPSKRAGWSCSSSRRLQRR